MIIKTLYAMAKCTRALKLIAEAILELKLYIMFYDDTYLIVTDCSEAVK